MTAVERAKRKAALLRDAEAIAERLRANRREHRGLLSERVEACRALRETGASVYELQDVFGVSRSRVHQILHGS